MSGWSNYVTIVRHWRRRAETRRTLQDLDPWQLADIGLSEAERTHECARWFWQGLRTAPPVARVGGEFWRSQFWHEVG